MSAEDRKAWMEEMPVLAAIRIQRSPDKGCGEFVRHTRFGDLYLRGEHYTLITPPS